MAAIHNTRNVLIYGFGRFGSVEQNPTEHIVHWLSEVALERVHIRGEVLPVSYRATRNRLERLLSLTSFDLVLGFGVAVGSAAVRVERHAYNQVDILIADTDGMFPKTETVLPGGADSLPARIDMGRLTSALRAIGAPCVISSDAGRYLCNYAFYLTCSLTDADCSVGFVHIPMATEFLTEHNMASSMPLSKIREVAHATVSAALESATSDKRTSTA